MLTLLCRLLLRVIYNQKFNIHFELEIVKWKYIDRKVYKIQTWGFDEENLSKVRNKIVDCLLLRWIASDPHDDNTCPMSRPGTGSVVPGRVQTRTPRYPSMTNPYWESLPGPLWSGMVQWELLIRLPLRNGSIWKRVVSGWRCDTLQTETSLGDLPSVLRTSFHSVVLFRSGSIPTSLSTSVWGTGVRTSFLEHSRSTLQLSNPGPTGTQIHPVLQFLTKDLTRGLFLTSSVIFFYWSTGQFTWKDPID